MAITITGSKYNGTVSSYTNKRLNISGATFSDVDFEDQRIVGLWTGGSYKGLAWVRRRISNNALEMEANFIDKDGNEVTPASGDTFQVSLNFNDVATTGLTISNNIISQSDNVIVGNDGDSDSVCFYDENKTINVSNDGGTFPYQFRGGLFVLGHLLNYEDRTFFNSVDFYSSDNGANGNQINVSDLSAKVWWLGGILRFSQTPARIPGGSSGSPAEWQKWWGVETNADLVTPGGGANWSSNNTNQQFINCGSLPSSNNAIGFRLSDSDFQGGFCKISGSSVISPFGADASGTYAIGAPANQRFNVLDMGTGLTKTAFWRKNQNNGSQFIEATNIISTDFRIGVGVNPGSSPYTTGTGSVNFKDRYTNAVPNTKLVILEDNNGTQASSGQSTSGEALELSVKYADLDGHTLTVNETDWQWGAIEYNRNIVSGLFSVSDVNTIDGVAKDVKHGAALIQSIDLSISQSNKSTVDSYTELDTPQKFYDRAKSFLFDSYAGETGTIVTRSGNTIDTGSYNVVLNNSGAAFAFNGTTITINAGSWRNAGITTTGTITIADGVDITGSTFSSLELNSGRDLNTVTVTGNLVFNDNIAGTYDLINSNIGTLRNDGSGLLTFSNSGSTVSNSSDAQINIVIAPTPSTMNLTTTGRWAIYDNSGSFVESGSGNKTYNNIGTDTGTWTVIVHRLGYQAEKFAWVSDNDTTNDFVYSDTQVIRPEGGQAYSGSATPSVSTSTSGDKILTLIGNLKVESQQVLDSIQDYLNTDSGLDWLHTYENLLSPTWGVLSGISYYLNVEGFVYDSTAGSTPESGVGGLIVSSASHLNVLTTNGGTIFASAVEDEIIDQDTFHAYLDAYTNKDDWKATGGTGGGGSYDDTALIAKVDVIDANVDNVTSLINALNDLSSADITSAVPSTSDIEAALLNEGDSQQLINAISTAIGNQNVDEIALVAAIRADIERTGGSLDGIKPDLVTINENVKDASLLIPASRNLN